VLPYVVTKGALVTNIYYQSAERNEKARRLGRRKAAMNMQGRSPREPRRLGELEFPVPPAVAGLLRPRRAQARMVLARRESHRQKFLNRSGASSV
jgi:hypothetical protein